MYYSRFKNNEKFALAAVAIAWLGSLVYGWMPVLSGAGEGFDRALFVDGWSSFIYRLVAPIKSSRSTVDGEIA